MKANEFRVGNYFDLYGSIAKLHPTDFNKWCKDFEFEDFKAIPLTEKWLLDFDFENWGYGKLYASDYEKYTRYVLFNVIDGTSNFEVHFITSTYGDSVRTEFICSIDEDERIGTYYDFKYVHQLQNFYFAYTNEELILNN